MRKRNHDEIKDLTFAVLDDNTCKRERTNSYYVYIYIYVYTLCTVYLIFAPTYDL